MNVGRFGFEKIFLERRIIRKTSFGRTLIQFLKLIKILLFNFNSFVIEEEINEVVIG